MRWLKTASKWILAIFMIVAGLNHFRSPGMYMKIMPPYLPWHEELVFLSGVAEAGLGLLLLIPKTSARRGNRPPDCDLPGQHLPVPESHILPAPATHLIAAAGCSHLQA
jgi:hypothetical protein